MELKPRDSSSDGEYRSDAASRSADAAAEVTAMAADPVQLTDRVFTVPNVLSFVRLLGVPLFLYLFLVRHADGWALAILFFSGVTDWLDGKLARLLNQASSLGALLDPAADRLYMLAIPLAFVGRDIFPWWVAAILIGRDLLLLCTLPVLRSRGLGPLPVHYLGKAATFALMYAFPLLLAAQGDWAIARYFEPWGYAFLIWGLGTYVWTAALYLIQVVTAARTLPRVGGAKSLPRVGGDGLSGELRR